MAGRMTDIPTRRLGDSDLEVTVVGLGGNQFGGRLDLEGTRAVVEAALEAGVTLFDTADIYGNSGGSETLLGEVLKGRWDEVVIATKFGGDMGNGRERRGSRDYIRHAVEGSLRRLQTDVIDLYQYHFPDPQTPIEETLGALDELVTDGKVRHVGCSNFSAAQIEEADETARRNGIARFVSVQNEYSLLERGIERDVVPVCERLNIGVLPYFPLARGLLTGKYRRGQDAPEGSRLAGRDDIASDKQWDELEELERFAQDRGLRLVDVAIGGLAAQPTVASVIAGATRPDQVDSNVAAAQWQPTTEDLEALDAIVPSPRPR
jgi:aryl-alcohol dehydrogenase-like predicted oxidoreductase